MAPQPSTAPSGPNDWLIEELRQQYRENPRSVPEAWRAVFADSESARPNGASSSGTPSSGTPSSGTPSNGTPSNGAPSNGIPTNGMVGGEVVANGTTADAAPEPVAAEPPAALPAAATTATVPAPAAPTAPSPAPAPVPAAAPAAAAAKEKPAEEAGELLRGVAARIVTNMEASLSVPTATSFREIPAKLLEVNRKILNNHLGRVRGGKVSFTHIMGYAIVRAIAETVPNLNSIYLAGADGKPRVIRGGPINLGLAVDQQKADGTRSLIVPVIKDTGSMDFAEFVAAYEALIKKVRDNKLTVDDMTGATISLTNVGTIGTVQSVPRLMPGQGAIIGIGRIDYPTAFEAADKKVIAQLGLSKVVNMTSTYDHRIIQGAESGTFLKRVHDLLIGTDNFYDGLFADVHVPYTAVNWLDDHGATEADDTQGLHAKQMAVSTLVNQYRVRGHLIANTNPLAETASELHPELDPATFGLTIWDLDRTFLTGIRDGVYASIGGQAKQMPLGDILGVLRDAYCRSIGIEYMHIADPGEKRWIQEQVESHAYSISRQQQHHVLERLTAAEALEKFLAARYVGQKRFGLEGLESTIPVLDSLLSQAADNNHTRAVLGMAHRGRLNVLVNIMGKAYNELFKEFEGAVSESSIQGSGDVKYHLGLKGTHESPSGNVIETELAPNPSHLETVGPVVVGMARAYMDQVEDGNYPVLPILLHGDAAFAGQGVVPETLNLSQVHGYKVGGTIHLITNNQLGYTTAPHHSRSSEYSTDVAKMVQAPIFHVNADDPEACVRVAELAFAYRQQFHKDVVIDLIGYRRHGHNEGDDPSYTQPMMYRKIADRASVRTLYTQNLIDRGDISVAEAESAMDYFQDILQGALDATRESAPPAGLIAKPSPPAIGVLPHTPTGATREQLDRVYAVMSQTPEGFTVHPKLARQFKQRDKMFAEGEVDWALGEAFAIGTLLDQGVSVRLAGQDSRRGTFAHRHATLHDYQNGHEYTPLTEAGPDGTEFWIYDSTLSEYAALGFEYGYTLANPAALVMWEAQFGDFVNGAQIIIDQFLVAAEDKWKTLSSLTMLLPHGYEGQGPEHSSGRLERFLLLCAEDNIQVVNATTAAQFFHLLRRQIMRETRKPLVVFTPKSGLRAKWSRSPIADLLEGSFEEVLDDPGAPKAKTVKRVIFASGKVAAEAEAHRDEIGVAAAVVRVEQLYPWPFADVARILEKYKNADEIVWLQEEPENMGSWNAVKGRLYETHGETHRIRRVSRTESGSPATGSINVHKQEQQELLERAFAGID